MNPDVVVVGAGVIGASIAYHLADAGASVALVDLAEPASPPSASWASAGGLRSQGRSAPEKPISRRAAERWRSLEEELGADLEVRLGGHLHLAETEAETASVRQRVREDAADGIPIELVDGSALRTIAPDVTDKALLGAYTAGDGQAHPGKTARAFAAAAQRCGAVMMFGQAAALRRDGDCVTGVRLADGGTVAAGRVVLAAGAWSCAILAGLGIELPLRWRGLQMLFSGPCRLALSPTVTAVGRNLSLKQVPSGRMMVGGRWFGSRPAEDAVATAPLADHVMRQWESAVAVVPAMERLSVTSSWAGAEAQTIDSLPFIGPAGLGSLYLATGFSNHGFQISPAVGALVAADLAGEGEPLLAPFRVERVRSVSPQAIATFRGEPMTN